MKLATFNIFYRHDCTSSDGELPGLEFEDYEELLYSHYSQILSEPDL